MVKIFDREQVSVRIATQHADDFTKNQIRILVEERLAFALYRPICFRQWYICCLDRSVMNDKASNFNWRTARFASVYL